MKKRIFAFLLALCLLLSGCQVTVNLQEDGPEIHVTPADQDGGFQIQLGEEKNGNDSGPSADSLSEIPPYSGSPYISVNGGTPYFTQEEITDRSYEFYSELDHLGRCGVTMASLGRDLMPTEKRESIQEVRPTGWVQNQYDWVDGKALYNRCHLIGFQLAGENANEKNLITGTRSMNIHGMLPFENMVADYIKETENHVMYRVTPLFQGDNLVAHGVLMEGLSVEDRGEGITFCVFAYNAEPGVTIDYETGENHPSQRVQTEEDTEGSYILNTGSRKFHLPGCSGAEKISSKNRETYHGSRQDLIDMGYKPCGSCKP